MAGSSFDDVFARLREGQMVLMVPEESEAAEGDLVMAAENRHARSRQLHGASRGAA